jgi:hypothetical protein
VHAAVHGNAAEEAHDSRFLCKAFEKVRARMRCCSRAITSSPQVSLAFSLRALICVDARNLQADKQFIPVLSVQSSAAAASAHDGSQETTSHLPSHSTLMITLESTSFCFSPWEVHS